MRDASLSVATTSCPSSARQLPDTSPTYPHPITANFTEEFPLRRTLFYPKSVRIDSRPIAWLKEAECRDCVAHAARSGFRQRKLVDDERVDAGTEITAHGIARRHNQRLAEQIERRVHQHGRGCELAESIEQPPK